MSNTRTRLRRAVSGGAAAVTVGATVLAFAPIASATTDATVTRIQGSDRYATAAQAATKAYTTSTTAILADGEPGHFPDALAGNYLAGQMNAPILLTRLASTPQVTLDALKTLGVQNVILLGQTGAISQAQQDALTAAGYTVTRLGGADRWETDKAVSEGTTNPVGTFNGKKTALVAYGLNFPDALAAGSLAFAQHFPVVITKAANLTPEAKATLTDLGIQQVIISGGTSVVQQGVVDDLTAMGISVLFRANGINRADTSAQLAQWEFDNISGWDKTGVGVASGYASGDGADALAGGVYTGKLSESMLVTFSNTSAGQQLLDFLTKNSATIKNITIFGGLGAVSQSAEDAILAAAKAVPSKNSYKVTPSTSQTAAEGKNVQYSVSGLDNTATYTIELFNCGNVSTDSSGNVTFTQTAPNSGLAAQGNTNNDTITVVNGVATGAGTTETTASPSGGALSFTVANGDTGTAAPTCVVPVVYSDTNTNNGSLDVDKTSGAPVENFGVGGEANFTPQAASAGPIPASTVTSVDKTANMFTAQAGGVYQTYTYKDGDTFQILTGGACVNTTMADWESHLSSGDQVAGVYSTNAASTFCLNNLNPAAPTNVTASQSGSSVVVNWTASAGDKDSYNIYRAKAASADCTTLADSAYQQIASVDGTKTSYTDSSVTVPSDASTNFYCYGVSAVNNGEESAVTHTTTAASVTKAAAADNTQPASTDAVLATDAGFTGLADAGDVWQIGFTDPDSPLAAPAAGDTIRLTDGDGTVVDVINGTNATFTLNTAATKVGATTYDAGHVLTVTLTKSPDVVTAGTTAGLAYPATVTNSSGITDTAGNRWDLGAASTDKTIG